MTTAKERGVRWLARRVQRQPQMVRAAEAWNADDDADRQVDDAGARRDLPVGIAHGIRDPAGGKVCRDQRHGILDVRYVLKKPCVNRAAIGAVLRRHIAAGHISPKMNGGPEARDGATPPISRPPYT
ncbi:hypothetical protein ACVWXQ_007325 [Bradyrhizobium sp. S3.14.4]